jgi:hypothetical protein
MLARYQLLPAVELDDWNRVGHRAARGPLSVSERTELIATKRSLVAYSSWTVQG